MIRKEVKRTVGRGTCEHVDARIRACAERCRVYRACSSCWTSRRSMVDFWSHRLWGVPGNSVRRFDRLPLLNLASTQKETSDRRSLLHLPVDRGQLHSIRARYFGRHAGADIAWRDLGIRRGRHRVEAYFRRQIPCYLRYLIRNNGMAWCVCGSAAIRYSGDDAGRIWRSRAE